MSRTRTGNPEQIARSVLKEVGGGGNVAAVTSCFTRLRFVLRDDAKVDTPALEKTDGVLSVVRAGGQVQVVMGNDVLAVRQAVESLLPAPAAEEAQPTSTPEGASGNLFDRFVALVSSLFQPFLWVLAGTGLLKALIIVLGVAGWLQPTDTTYIILNAGADSLFYFLPMFLAFTAGKRFGANQFVSLALAGGLVYPSIVTLAGGADPVTFLGIPVVMATYTSSVVPIIVIVWVQSHLERWLKKLLPSAAGNFLSPALVVLILFPLSLMTIGPATTYLSNAIAAGVSWLYTASPAIGGFLVGAIAQVLVIFGLHWALIAVIINDYATQGHSFVVIPFYAAVAAQTGAAFAVFLRTRDAKLKQVAGPASLSGFLAGITEPILYGVNLPLRRPFIIGLVCGGLGGAVSGLAGVASKAFAVPSLITMPIALGTGNFPLFVIGVVGAMVLAFVLTLLFGVKKAAPANAATTPVPAGASPVPGPTAAATTSAGRTTLVLAPVAGATMPVESMPDKVFASGALGRGVSIEPTEGRVVAPVAGEIKACLPHAYGIRTDTGVEVLVHIGIDTVRLKGEHFTSAVAAGDRVAPGDLLATVDLEAVRAAGYDLATAVVVTNSARLPLVEPVAAGVVSAGDPVIRIQA